MRWLDNLKIRSKLQLLLVPLVSLLFLLLAQIISDKWTRYEDARTSLETHDLIQLFTNLVHEIQIERGLSEAHIGSNGTKYKQRLQQQRSQVDVEVDRLKNFIQKKPYLSPFILDNQELVKILLELDKLDETRLVVDAQYASKYSFEYFSNFNALSLHLIRHVSLNMDDPSLIRYTNAIGNLIWLQEYAGRERAIFSRMLTSGQVDNDDIKTMQGYIANQETLLTQFNKSEADHKHVERLSKIFDKPAFHKVYEMRQTTNNTAELQKNISSIKFSDWFKYTTRRIKLFQGVSDEISEEMAVYAKNEKDSAFVELVTYGVLAFLSLAVALFLSLIISRRLESGIKTIHYALEVIRDTGELTVKVQEHGNDEIGSMLSSFNRMVEERNSIDSALQKSQRQLKAAKEESDKANQAKSEFLSRMSHELRTPMNAILGFGQILEIDKQLDSKHKETIREILMAGNHLLGLINDVLDLAKIESGHIKMDYQDVNTHTLLSEATLLVAPLAECRNITLEYEPGVDETMFINVDPKRMKEVMLNLLSNAIKYNSKDGKVTVNCMNTPDGYCRIEVADTGEGLSDEQMQRMFQPFERLGAENTTIEGTGIGLVICKRIIEAMGGTIGAESVVGQGSTFWVEVRLSEKLNKPQKSDIKEEQGSKFICDISNCKVLYVEDNPSNLRLMEHIFENHTNIPLISTMNPHDALDIIKEHQPRLILMDINMPGINGIDLTKMIRKCDDAKDILIVAVSANAMFMDIEKVLASGFDDYITKPINITQFIKLLTELLHKPFQRMNKHNVSA